MSKTKELNFEDHIEQSLLTDGGWSSVGPRTLDRSSGLFIDELISFVTATQPEAWQRLVGLHGSEETARSRLARRVAQELDNPSRNGAVDLLRNGVVDLGVDVKLAYFRPAHSLTETLETLYRSNRLAVVRQLDVGGWKRAAAQEIDLVLVVNGIPVATAELKNPQTGQRIGHAVAQYREGRDPTNPILRRCVVHFAADPDEVKMTTSLAGEATRFLPFNRGNEGGRGNPAVEGKHRTHYLWETVWSRDVWMDILGRFVHTETDPETKERKTIFPRFHQWDAVLKLVAASREDGPGTNYLIQHSAGSGKSNTIAWTAHRLANLHDEDNDKVFDKVIVITDRVVLDDQLGETVDQFESARGVVRRIDSSGGSKSSNLAEALTDASSKIVTCTLQTFGFVIDKLQEAEAATADMDFAVLVDEAHSSQTGTAATAARASLTVSTSGEEALEEAEEVDAAEEAKTPDSQEQLAGLVAGRGRQDNISFYAFTATPKARTRELFGTLETVDGEPRYAAFHTYTMRQAIEEGFILDVLANYTTYKSYWRIEKSVRDDPNFDERKAKAAIARFVSLHPTNLAQKAEVIVEHFRQKVAHRIGGHAKAMVVTSSRLHAVRYKQALDSYIAAQGYDDVRTLVAFSGKVIDSGDEYTESGMNAFPERETARRFDTDDYQVMIVAEKFQTGFDQPLLHTMYVDKTLTGLNAVQTLSRLNRTHPGKSECFVLDFRNEADQITKAFAPYYEHAYAAPTDPNLMYDARTEIERHDVIRADDLEAFATAFAASTAQTHEQTEAALNPAVDRYNNLPEDDQEDFKKHLDEFIRIYGFLSQVVTFTDVNLEKLYVYGRALRLKLRDDRGGRLDISDKVELTHLRTDLTWEGDASVDEPVHEQTQFWGTRPLSEEAQEALSIIVREMNDKHGTELTDEHKLTLKQYESAFVSNPDVVQAATANNDFEAFKKVAFSPVFLDTIINQMDANEEIFKLILAEDRMRELFTEFLARSVYDQIRSG